jgi:hypothetical protein
MARGDPSHERFPPSGPSHQSHAAFAGVEDGAEINVDLNGQIDSVHGGIRSTFEAVPDAWACRL